MTIAKVHYDATTNKRLPHNSNQAVYYFNIVNGHFCLTHNEPMPNTVAHDDVSDFTYLITETGYSGLDNAHIQATKKQATSLIEVMSWFAMTDNSINEDKPLRPASIRGDVRELNADNIADAITDLDNLTCQKLASLINRLAEAREMQDKRGFSDKQKWETVRHIQSMISDMF